MKVLTDQEIAQILAALRYWQSDSGPDIEAAKEMDHFEDGSVEPMTDEAIDELCESINTDTIQTREKQSDADKKRIEKARQMYQQDGEIEVDDNAPVSKAEDNPDHGAYVQAWVWVSDEDADLCSKCQADVSKSEAVLSFDDAAYLCQKCVPPEEERQTKGETESGRKQVVK